MTSKREKTQITDRNLTADAFKTTLPVMAGYLVLGIGFGFVMTSSGYGTLWSTAEAVFIYAGSMQYAAVELLRSGASLLSAAVTTLAVNARHLFYGISMLDEYRKLDRGKWYAVLSLTDETYSLLCGRDLPEDTRDRNRYILTVSLLDHLYWICGCTIGGLLSSVMPSGLDGIDFALTALFVSAFTGQWQGNEDHRPAIAGVGCTVLSLLIFGRDRFLIPAMIMITAVLLIMRRSSDEA